MNFFSLIFDQGCLLCGHQDAFSEKYGLCCSCAFPLLFARKRGPLCSVCGRPLISEDGICMRCRSRDYSFDRNSYFWEYSDNAKAVVGFYKFKGHRRVGRFLALCLWRYLRHRYPDGVLLIPAPCSSGRLKKYGFNHITRICRMLKRDFGIPFADVLHRRRGVQLKKLNREQRKEEIRNKIYMNDRDASRMADLCNGKSVVFLDDIFTTGATASTCARVLRESGIKDVDIVTFALD